MTGAIAVHQGALSVPTGAFCALSSEEGKRVAEGRPSLTRGRRPDYHAENQNYRGHDYNQKSEAFDRVADYEKRCIITPALKSVFNRLVHAGDFVVGMDKVIDIGCGTGHIMVPFLKDGIHVDGFDIASKMVDVAKGRLRRSGFYTSDIIVVDDYSSLGAGEYAVGMMNFVQGCCPNKKSLFKLFSQANHPLRNGGRLIVTGAHPEHLHHKHSACEYDVVNARKLKDGAVVTGRLFSAEGTESYELTGGYIWKINTLVNAAKKAGFSLNSLEEIQDSELSSRRPKSAHSPYVCLTFTKEKRSLSASPQ